MATSIYENVKRAIQDVIAPELRTIDGKIETLRVEIKRLDSRIDGLEKHLTSIEDQLHSFRAEILSTIECA